jgi:hypothetical protein
MADSESPLRARPLINLSGERVYVYLTDREVRVLEPNEDFRWNSNVPSRVEVTAVQGIPVIRRTEATLCRADIQQLAELRGGAVLLHRMNVELCLESSKQVGWVPLDLALLTIDPGSCAGLPAQRTGLVCRRLELLGWI